MKPFFLIIPLSILCLHGQTTEKPAPANAATHYQNGINAMASGDVANAETSLRACLKLQPNNPEAKYQLNHLLLHRDEFAARYRENMMKKVIIKTVDYAEADINECLTSLTTLIEEQTGKKFTPNFVIKDPEQVWKDQRITLKLTNVPAAAVLKYILTTAQGKASYDEHTIVVSPMKKP